MLVKIKDIIADKNQPRKYFDDKKMEMLKKSISREGIINPIVVESIGDGKYKIVDGERRFRTATLLGLKEVPCILLQVKDDTEKLIKQFQIQEMHENWTPIEKAGALEDISVRMNQPLRRVCEILGLSEDITQSYVIFSTMFSKDLFIKHNIPLIYMEKIRSLKNVVKKIYTKSYTVDTDKKIEKACINRIVNKDIIKAKNVTNIKDCFTKDPSYIDKFIDTDITVKRMLNEVVITGAFHLRNTLVNARYVGHHARKLLESDNVTVSKEDLVVLKNTVKTLNEVINKVE